MFKYNLQFRNTTAHANADSLSRLPLKDTAPLVNSPPELVLLVDHLNSIPITADQINKVATRRDQDLFIILQYVHKGWPHRDAIENHVMSLYDQRDELAVHDRRSLTIFATMSKSKYHYPLFTLVDVH